MIHLSITLMPFYKSNKIQIEKFNMFLLSSSVQIMYYAVGLSNSSATQLVHVWIHVCNSCLDPKITLTHKLQYGASLLTCFEVCLKYISKHAASHTEYVKILYQGEVLSRLTHNYLSQLHEAICTGIFALANSFIQL